MKRENKLSELNIDKSLLIKKMLLGAGIAFMVIAFFVLSAGEGKPEWGNLWQIRPLTITPLAGGIGGAFYYFMVHWLHLQGWKKTLAIAFSLLAYAVALWMGIILGLVGTLWN